MKNISNSEISNFYSIMTNLDLHAEEILNGTRFEFGANWSDFLKLLTEDRIVHAVDSLKNMLCVSDLHGKSFLDAGSGSGLFSLAARRLGARVHSFDFDPKSVACTAELKSRFFPNDLDWTIDEASVLDTTYLSNLEKFDIVYSWGVLHHTGQMWNAIENISNLVAKNGIFFIAIYNDQGSASKTWWHVKKLYCRLSPFPKKIILLLSFLRLWGPTMIKDLFRFRPFFHWNSYIDMSVRGMDPWRDVVDWVGGFPFEVAQPEEIFDFFTKKNFTLRRLRTCAGGLGCNEFVFSLN